MSSRDYSYTSEKPARKESTRLTPDRKLFSRILLACGRADVPRPTASRGLHLTIAVSATLICASFGSVSSAAAAETAPWWHLGIGTRAAYLQPGQERNEVQEVVGTPAAGEAGVAFELLANKESLGFFGSEPLAAEFEIPVADAATIQTALEGPYGAGNVSVTGGPVGEAPLIVTTINEKAGQAVAPIEIEEVGFGKVTSNVITAGSPDGEVFFTAENVGTAPVQGKKQPARLSVELPENLVATVIAGTAPEASANGGIPLKCNLASLSCEFTESLAPYQQLEVRIGVRVMPEAQSGEINLGTVTGANAPAATVTHPITVAPGPSPFGVEDFRLGLEESGGREATNAGIHPFQVTGTVAINQGSDKGALTGGSRPRAEVAGLAKDVVTKLPAGLVGNPTVVPTCSLDQFQTVVISPSGKPENACPADSAVGIASATLFEPQQSGFGTLTLNQPLFNLEASPGEPARFGFFVGLLVTPVVLDTAVRSEPGGDYGINVDARNISQAAGLSSARVTFWGVPGDPRHDASRGWGCLDESLGEPDHSPCIGSQDAAPAPLLQLPTSCAGPLQALVEADPWIHPGAFEISPPFEPIPALVGCNQLPFSPTISSEPTSNAATSPTGLNFDLDVNDEGLANSEGTVQSQIKKAVVTLPEGFTTNPSVAEGLKACTEAQYEASTYQPGTGCPEESKIGDVEVESPLVAQKLEGSLFVAQQTQNPNHNLLTIYMVVQSPLYGVLIKSAGEVKPNPLTGQLVTTFDDIPQIPFDHFHLSFRQGQRSPLVTPSTCGTYTVNADLYPWSNPTVPRHEQSSFQITQGPEGQPCPNGVPPFHPALLAGSENPTAGAYSPFYTEITRKDSEQEITRFSIKLPPGVIGKLAGVAECSDAQIAQAKSREVEGGGTVEQEHPSCPANSEVGHTLVGSGVGNVLAYAPGKLYLAGPYHGSNISLVSITAAKVGPFDLGTVVVRFALKIDPETAEVFVDGQGSDPIPHIVDGIPVHLRDIRAYVDRPNFTLNPTSCAKKSTASTVLGSGLNFASEADDQPVTVTSPFQAADCASLGFKPKLALSLKGGTKRGDTPKFKAVVTYPTKGAYANIAAAQVTLPHSEFLDNAHIRTVCTRVQFNEGAGNGAACPPDSVYGFAKAVTPLLDEPVEGPVFLRSSSHQLPDLVAALHNKQVNFDLDGHVEGVKGGIRNTFEAVPDAPVTKFTLEMQGGKKGLLENSTNLCNRPHRATSHLTGQNGKTYDTRPLLAVKCGGKGKHKHRGGKR